MAPDLSEKLLGIDIDADRRGDSDGDEDEQEQLVQFVFVGVGEHQLALPVDAVRTITEPPAELTRVPRGPPAIEGLMDLRGEITAVIDSHVHFPVNESRSGRERLLVLDRPSDQQSAAIRVDEVLGVETVPESNILDRDDVENSDFSGNVLEHPLIVALVTQERTLSGELEKVASDEAAGVSTDTEIGGEPGVDSIAAVSSTAEPSDETIGETFELESTEDVVGEPDGVPFELESADDGDAESDTESENEESTREIVVEATALIDVDRLLLASGQS